MKRAIIAAKIASRTGDRWLARGRADLDAGDDFTQCAALATMVDTAHAQIVARAEHYLHRAQDLPDEKLCAKDKLHNVRWILRTLARDEYGDNTGSVEKAIQRHTEELVEALATYMSSSAHEELIVGILRYEAALAAADDTEPAPPKPPAVH